jgi:hypothetical protein
MAPGRSGPAPDGVASTAGKKFECGNIALIMIYTKRRIHPKTYTPNTPKDANMEHDLAMSKATVFQRMCVRHKGRFASLFTMRPTPLVWFERSNAILAEFEAAADPAAMAFVHEKIQQCQSMDELKAVVGALFREDLSDMLSETPAE